MSIRRLSHVVLRCADVERSRQFYEALGLELSPEQHGAGPKHYSCTLSGVVLELYPFAGKPTSGLRLGVVVSDLEKTVEALSALRIAVSATSGAARIVTDPDGHQIVIEEERTT